MCPAGVSLGASRTLGGEGGGGGWAEDLGELNGSPLSENN